MSGKHVSPRSEPTPYSIPMPKNPSRNERNCSTHLPRSFAAFQNQLSLFIAICWGLALQHGGIPAFSVTKSTQRASSSVPEQTRVEENKTRTIQKFDDIHGDSANRTVEPRAHQHVPTALKDILSLPLWRRSATRHDKRRYFSSSPK